MAGAQIQSDILKQSVCVTGGHVGVIRVCVCHTWVIHVCVCIIHVCVCHTWVIRVCVVCDGWGSDPFQHPQAERVRHAGVMRGSYVCVCIIRVCVRRTCDIHVCVSYMGHTCVCVVRVCVCVIHVTYMCVCIIRVCVMCDGWGSDPLRHPQAQHVLHMGIMPGSYMCVCVKRGSYM